jgi:hypothetical protein
VNSEERRGETEGDYTDNSVIFQMFDGQTNKNLLKISTISKNNN